MKKMKMNTRNSVIHTKTATYLIELEVKQVNILHKVEGWHLNVPSRKGTYTTRYPKYCSDNYNDLLSELDKLSDLLK